VINHCLFYIQFQYIKIPPKVLKRLMLVGSLIEHELWYMKEISGHIWDIMFNSELTREDKDTTIIKTL